MFCHLGTLWLPTWFSAKIFACDCSLGKTNVLRLFSWLKTQERHAVTALFLHLPWFSSYLQHCPKTENWLMIKRYHWVLQRGWNNWVLPSRYGVPLTFFTCYFVSNSILPLCLTGAGANLLNGNSRSNDKGKNFYYQKIMGSCVSEGVQAIRCELVSSSCWKPVPFLDMRALHNEAVMEIGLLRILLFIYLRPLML